MNRIPETLAQQDAPVALSQVSEVREGAILAARQGNYPQAIALFSHLIQYDASSATYYNNRGLIYFRSGQFDQAVADYNRAIQLNPRLASAYNNRANYYAAQGDLEAAIADYEEAIDLDPSNLRARINLAITFRDLGLHHLAVEGLDTALCLSNRVASLSSTDTHSVTVGHIYAERGRSYHLLGDWNYAIADYCRALKVLPQATSMNRTISQRLAKQVESWLGDLLNPAHQDSLCIPESE